MRIRPLFAALGAAAVVLVVFIAGVVVGGHPQATGLDRLGEPVRSWVLGDSGQGLPGQVLDVLQREYYEPIDADALEQASVDGLIDQLGDPYTTYLNDEELEALRNRNDGAYVGVGIQVAVRDEALVVTRIFDGGSAGEAGVRVGDRLLAVDGVPIRGDRSGDAVERIRGPEGTTVWVAVRTGSQPPRRLELERRRIIMPAVAGRVIRDSGRRVAHLRLIQFSRGAGDQMRATLQRLLDRGADAVVLDMRQDPGGLVSEAVDVAGVFLEPGTAVVTTEGHNSPARTLRTQDDPLDTTVPMSVLVDRHTASAAEIVAGALTDADRATLVGERTFGKALVQSTRMLRGGGALKLTTARYLTPSGYDLARRGLPPTVSAVDDPATPADEALDRAVAVATARVP